MYLPNLVYEYQQKHLPALCYLDCNHVSNLIKHIWQNFDGNIKPQHNHDKQTSENNHNNEEQRRTVQEAGEEKLIYMRVITSHNQVHTIHVCLCVHLPCSLFSSNLWKFPLSIICFSQKCSNHHQTTRATSLHFNIQTYMLVHKYICICVFASVCALQLFTFGFTLLLFVVIVVSRHLYWVNEACAKLINKPDNANNHLLQLQQKQEKNNTARRLID